MTAAQKASAAKGSSASWPPAVIQRWVGAGWSVNPIPSKPASSAARANSTTPRRVANSALARPEASG